MDLSKVNRIDKEYINGLKPLRFEGEVVLVDTPEQEEMAVRELRHETAVGFDTESRPAFKKGDNFPVSLVQIATLETAYLFQVDKTGFTDALAAFLANPDIKKIGVGLKHDVVKLQELKQFKAGGFVDLSHIAKEKGIIQVGARGLTARYTGCRLVKSAQKTNWAKPDLTWRQQIYAACDAWVCLEIYPHLLADKTDYRKFIEKDSEDDIREKKAAAKEAASQRGTAPF